MTTATPAQRDAFATAVEMAQQLVIDGTPAPTVAAYWGLTEQDLAAGLIQFIGNLMSDVAKVTKAGADFEAMLDGLRPNDDED